MDKRIKELAEQADAYAEPLRFSLGGQNYQQVRDERFAELVRQDYLRELKALKPVAWQNLHLPDEFYDAELLDPSWYSHYRPLYALDEVKK